MFTLYSDANTPFSQSEHAYYLSYFIKLIIMGTYNSHFTVTVGENKAGVELFETAPTALLCKSYCLSAKEREICIKTRSSLASHSLKG